MAAKNSKQAVASVRRARAAAVVLSVCALVMSGRLIQVQALDPDNLADQARSGRIQTATLAAPRGAILDAQGKPLATTVERYTITASPKVLKEFDRKVVNPDTGEIETVVQGPREAARDLAPVLGVPEEELFKKISDLGSRPGVESQYTVLAKEVAPDVWHKVKDLGIPVINREYVTRRNYPGGALAGNVIGFLGKDPQSTARAGLEREFDNYLRGKDGEEQYERGRYGQRIPTAFSRTNPPIPGRDIHTTLRSDVQWYAQEVVKDTVQEFDAEWGAIIVQDPKTFDILALAEFPTVDPNKPGASKPEDMGSRALRNVYEPGSTAKAITAAMAIEEGLVEPTTKMKIPYKYTTANGRTIKDSHSHALQKRTFAGVVAESSNTGTVMIGQKASKETRYEYLTKFGFGQPTGLNFPGETKGILAHYDDWDGHQKYAVLFGQGVATNVLQATQVMTIIASGGVAMTPRLVKGVSPQAGSGSTEDIEEFVQPEPNRVVSEDTARKVATMLEGVVVQGTGDNAALEGYRVAGKTGTSQVAGPRGYDGTYTASFIGFAPADRPAAVVSVVIQRPKNAHYGGTVAAPAFNKVMGYTLSTMKVAPTGSPQMLYPISWE